MKKTWISIFLSSIIAFAPAYSMHDEEDNEGYENEVADQYNDEPTFQDDSIAYEDRAEEHYSTPLRRSRPRNSERRHSLNTRGQSEFKTPGSSQKKTAAAGKRAENRNRPLPNSYRSKLKDARENSNRPRVTHRSQKQAYSNIQQMEADAQQENVYPNEEAAPKASSPLTEKKTSHIQRRPYLRKGIKSRVQRIPRREEARAHAGKRPLSH